MAKRQFHWSTVLDCVLHETDGTGATTVEYTHEPSPFGPLLSENRGGTEYYHHYDALGSTTQLTDDTGAVTDTFTFDAWGNRVARTGTTPTPYTWCGRWGYQDDTATTGGYYIRERTYEPTVARWMSMDLSTSGYIGSLYAYVNSQITLLIDPEGLLSAAPKSLKPKPTKKTTLTVSGIKPSNLDPHCNNPHAFTTFLFKISRWPCRSEIGYFVQQVRGTCFFAACAANGQTANYDFQYYEAWQLVRGQGLSVPDTADFTGSDTGRYTQRGTVRFYCVAPEQIPPIRGEITEGEVNDPAWVGPGAVYGGPLCNTVSGVLHSRGSMPPFWNRPAAAGDGNRFFTLVWNCCCAPNTASADARPKP